MDRLEFNCVFDLADTLQAMLGDVVDDYPLISVYGKYDVIKSLLEDLIMSGVKIANEIELEDYDVAHYDKPFVLYLSTYGANVEKAYRDGSYLYGAGNISFVHEDCNSKLLPYVQSDVIYEFGITDEDDECDCEECQCACKDKEIAIETDGDMHGFSVNQSGENGWSSYSFYSTDLSLVNEMAKLFR